VPGRVVLLLAPEALKELSARHRLALVSGTNGKTTTTRYLATAMRAKEPVVTNDDGSNLARGLVSALIGASQHEGSLAVLEVDEHVLITAIDAHPDVVVMLNLSRDQLDRSSEVGRIKTLWTAAVVRSPTTTVVVNADDPLLVACVTEARPDGHDVVWVAAGADWQSDAPVCPVCQGQFAGGRAFRCTSCDFARPTPHWSVEGDLLHRPDGPPMPLHLPLPGQANRGNAALAIAAAHRLGVDPGAALAQLQTVTHIAGRYRLIHAEGCDAQLLLAKNPASWKEMLTVLDGRDNSVVLSVNAREADGKDPSWLWDVPFELLRGKRIVVTGERADDLRVRLDYADVPHETAPDVVTALRLLTGDRVDVVGNYTAFQDARRALEHHAV
jgi:UDP-N-acetylmuramyl tripeptide synthase